MASLILWDPKSGCSCYGFLCCRFDSMIGHGGAFGNERSLELQPGVCGVFGYSGGDVLASHTDVH
jgi:hypothetical protein